MGPGSPVYVRSAAPTWWPGTVQAETATTYIVNLSTPLPTANQWSGVDRRYGGDQPVSQVTVQKSAFPNEGCHIKPRTP
jgi:hypothetical protein